MGGRPSTGRETTLQHPDIGTKGFANIWNLTSMRYSVMVKFEIPFPFRFTPCSRTWRLAYPLFVSSSVKLACGFDWRFTVLSGFTLLTHRVHRNGRWNWEGMLKLRRDVEIVKAGLAYLLYSCAGRSVVVSWNLHETAHLSYPILWSTQVAIPARRPRMQYTVIIGG